MTLTHAPGRIPPIILNGRSFVVRADSTEHSPVPKDVKSDYSLGGARRRSVFKQNKEWLFEISCRGWDDRHFLENLHNNMGYASYQIEFQDGVTAATYQVAISEMGTFEPVADNIDYWDVELKLVEWV